MRDYTHRSRTIASGEITGRVSKRVAVSFGNKLFAAIRADAAKGEPFGSVVRRLCEQALEQKKARSR